MAERNRGLFVACFIFGVIAILLATLIQIDGLKNVHSLLLLTIIILSYYFWPLCLILGILALTSGKKKFEKIAGWISILGFVASVFMYIFKTLI